MKNFSHFNQEGHAQMVDISGKAITKRRAIASGEMLMAEMTMQLIKEGKHSKGDVLGIARIAGIMAAKQTQNLIPLCHSMMLSHVSIDFELQVNLVKVVTVVETVAQTGVEMEALMAVNIALLTVYDMCKAVDKRMKITNIQLEEKHGGKSGSWYR